MDRPDEPALPEDVIPQMLDRVARGRLRTLSKNNAELVARHLVMAGRLLDEEPEAAYQHALAAARRAGRVDVVREGLALAAYSTGRYAEALRELRTVRRLSGTDAHRPMEADCERGLGRPERALALVAETDRGQLSEEDRVELAIVASGARADLKEYEAALLVLESADLDAVTDPELRSRLDHVRADRLADLGRTAEAHTLRESLSPTDDEDAVVEVYDLGEDLEDAGEPAAPPSPAGGEPEEPSETVGDEEVEPAVGDGSADTDRADVPDTGPGDAPGTSDGAPYEQSSLFDDHSETDDR